MVEQGRSVASGSAGFRQHLVDLEAFLEFELLKAVHPHLEHELNCAFCELTATEGSPTVSDTFNVARVIRLSTLRGQHIFAPNVGFMSWLRCDDDVYTLIKRGHMCWLLDRGDVDWDVGPNLVITECLTLVPGFAARELLKLRKLPGIKRIGAFRRGKWHEVGRKNNG